MNIIEALKTGRRIRRQAWLLNTDKEYWKDCNVYETLNLKKEDVLATDWEVEDVVVIVRGTEFDAAWNKAMIAVNGQTDLHTALRRELGLEPGATKSSSFGDNVPKREE